MESYLDIFCNHFLESMEKPNIFGKFYETCIFVRIVFMCEEIKSTVNERDDLTLWRSFEELIMFRVFQIFFLYSLEDCRMKFWKLFKVSKNKTIFVHHTQLNQFLNSNLLIQLAKWLLKSHLLNRRDRCLEDGLSQCKL